MKFHIGLIAIVFAVCGPVAAGETLAERVAPRLASAAAGTAGWTDSKPAQIVPVAEPQGREIKPDVEAIARLVLAIGDVDKLETGAVLLKLPPTSEHDTVRGYDWAYKKGKIAVTIRRRADGTLDILFGISEPIQDPRGEVSEVYAFLASRTGTLVKTAKVRVLPQGSNPRLETTYPPLTDRVVDAKFQEVVRYWQKWEQEAARAAAR